MSIVTFTNSRDKYIQIYKKAPFMLQSMDGLGDVDADVQMQKAPYQDGENFLDVLLNPRPIPISFVILADSPDDLSLKKRLVGEVFSPKHGIGTLTYNFYGRNYEIEAVAEGVPSFPSGRDNRGLTYQTVIVDMLAPDPYWKEPRTVSRSLRAYQGKFTFPFEFPVELGISGDTTNLFNAGDTPTNIQIEIQGAVKNPQIINHTTGQRLRINRTIRADEVLHIDTSPLKKRVEIYRGGETIEKAIGYLDHYSDFFRLGIGGNEVSYVADEADGDSIVAVSWRNRFTAI